MTPPKHVKLGSRTRAIVEGAIPNESDEFPAHQAWADDVERVLAFLEMQGQFQRYLPRLRARAKERDAALAEARAGFYFHQKNFSILQWEPVAVPG